MKIVAVGTATTALRVYLYDGLSLIGSRLISPLPTGSWTNFEFNFIIAKTAAELEDVNVWFYRAGGTGVAAVASCQIDINFNSVSSSSSCSSSFSSCSSSSFSSSSSSRSSFSTDTQTVYMWPDSDTLAPFSWQPVGSPGSGQTQLWGLVNQGIFAQGPWNESFPNDSNAMRGGGDDYPGADETFGFTNPSFGGTSLAINVTLRGFNQSAGPGEIKATLMTDGSTSDGVRTFAPTSLQNYTQTWYLAKTAAQLTNCKLRLEGIGDGVWWDQVNEIEIEVILPSSSSSSSCSSSSCSSSFSSSSSSFSSSSSSFSSSSSSSFSSSSSSFSSSSSYSSSCSSSSFSSSSSSFSSSSSQSFQALQSIYIVPDEKVSPAVWAKYGSCTDYDCINDGILGGTPDDSTGLFVLDDFIRAGFENPSFQGSCLEIHVITRVRNTFGSDGVEITLYSDGASSDGSDDWTPGTSYANRVSKFSVSKTAAQLTSLEVRFDSLSGSNDDEVSEIEVCLVLTSSSSSSFSSCSSSFSSSSFSSSSSCSSSFSSSSSSSSSSFSSSSSCSSSSSSSSSFSSSSSSFSSSSSCSSSFSSSSSSTGESSFVNLNPNEDVDPTWDQIGAGSGPNNYNNINDWDDGTPERSIPFLEAQSAKTEKTGFENPSYPGTCTNIDVKTDFAVGGSNNVVGVSLYDGAVQIGQEKLYYPPDVSQTFPTFNWIVSKTAAELSDLRVWYRFVSGVQIRLSATQVTVKFNSASCSSSFSSSSCSSSSSFSSCSSSSSSSSCDSAFSSSSSSSSYVSVSSSSSSAAVILTLDPDADVSQTWTLNGQPTGWQCINDWDDGIPTRRFDSIFTSSANTEITGFENPAYGGVCTSIDVRVDAIGSVGDEVLGISLYDGAVQIGGEQTISVTAAWAEYTRGFVASKTAAELTDLRVHYRWISGSSNVVIAASQVDIKFSSFSSSSSSSSISSSCSSSCDSAFSSSSSSSSQSFSSSSSASGAWVQHHLNDSTGWSCQSNCSWNATFERWQVAGPGMSMVEQGTWVEDYRPIKVRITANHSLGGNWNLSLNPGIATVPIPTGGGSFTVEVDCDFSGDTDITGISESQAPGTGYITNIEFLEV